MRHEIRVPIRKLRDSGFVLLGAVLLFTMIGGFVSPLDGEGRPLLLLPEVKAVEDYRRMALEWLGDLKSLEGEIRQVTSGNGGGDLFSLSRQAQQALEEAVRVAREVDRVEVPPVCIELHQQMVRVSLAYLEAARSALGWVSVPREESLFTAVNALENASQFRMELEDNPWLTGP